MLQYTITKFVVLNIVCNDVVWGYSKVNWIACTDVHTDLK